MSGFEHPECAEGLEFEGELALARGLVASGEFSHGAKHAAACLADDPTDPGLLELLEHLHAELGELAPDVVEQDAERGYWSGEAALRAWMLRAVGRREEASELLLGVVGADPSRRWARLLREWVEADPEWPLPARAAQVCCGSVIEPMLHRDPTEAEARTLSDLTSVLERCLSQNPDAGPLHWIASGIARRAGSGPDAVRWAEAGDMLVPSMVSACMVGYARRSVGDEAGAAAAFAQASERSPDDPSPRLDAADSFAKLGQWRAASEWASAAWRVDPELPSAAARACYAAWKATGDEGHILRLLEWILDRCPEPERDALVALGDALRIASDAQRELPWVAFIPVPSNVSVNIARQFKESESAVDGSGGGGSARIAFSAPEAPSAVLALEHVVEGPVEVVTTAIPKPDPRIPRRKVKVESWRLERGRLVPGVKPPAAPVLQAMRVTSTWLYTVADVRRDAARLVGSGVKRDDLVSLAVHPQPGPTVVDAPDWIRRWQVVCCFALALLGEFRVLTDLADGPEDWICDAALASLVELSVLEPRQRKAVLQFAERHLAESARRLGTLDLPDFGSECDALLMIPDCPSELAAAARDLKSSWLSSYSNE